MNLQFYNSLSRTKETLEPLNKGRVGMYVCGPTVYARPHIGNARSVVVYDVLFRLLRHIYGEKHVTYVRNITDVDDKINAAAIERGITIQALTAEVTQQFHDDMGALNCLRPNIEPRATEHIDGMITMIETLIHNGNAYVGSDGQHVLFDVTSASNHASWKYGMLSGRTIEEQQAGARVAVESYKKHPGDFVLWKPADAQDDDSSKFDSPWGVGRPGWHIECSVMSTEYLGHSFDIHGGGADLKFPHHENEIAQSCCAHPHGAFAKLWVHNGFLTVNGEKMSKSLGNFITVKDLLDKGIKGEVIRLALLSAKYNEPLDWNDKVVSDAQKTLDYGYRAFKSVGFSPLSFPRKRESSGDTSLDSRFRGNDDMEDLDSLLNDLNMVGQINTMRALAREIMNPAANETKEFLEWKCLRLCKIGDMLGVLQQDPKIWFEGNVVIQPESSVHRFASTEATVQESVTVNLSGTAILSGTGNISANLTATITNEGAQRLVNERTEFKKVKNWKEADAIRDTLKQCGIILEDRPDGTTDWRRG